jgi:hypothetical protein
VGFPNRPDLRREAPSGAGFQNSAHDLIIIGRRWLSARWGS